LGYHKFPQWGRGRSFGANLRATHPVQWLDKTMFFGEKVF